MALHLMAGSDRAWVWHAMDAADGEPTLELLAIKFKDLTIAASFKEMFEGAQTKIRLQEAADDGGQIGSQEEGGATASSSSISHAGDGVAKATPSSKVGGEVNPEEEREFHFHPIVKLPDNVDIITGEEQEVAVFLGRGKLYRFDGGVRQWKERGVGDMKIMKEEETDVYRIVMRRDQIHKVCANHYITSSMALHPMAGSDRAWVWHAMDAADGEPTSEQLAIKLKDPSIAASFKEMFEEAQTKIRLQEAADDGGQTGTPEEGGATASSSSSTSRAEDGVAKATPSSKGD
ncbi:ran-specific GTPase-activating protein [Strongylocentrotus purpuratus]|uniref:RanBD1 domain-containing protein n=1 Tax=Strongylocentrotus purpuratus TaxID=7668 RepID=A0A7M7NK62_STRPU|nr:ran-specific GTPase-activating protein [Strongylocentrotus purpuratus]XP_030837728.1 ran-specific GTPase-activating protein [Strongylocentrotus purpuratus]